MITMKFDKFISLLTAEALKRNIESPSKIFNYIVEYNDDVQIVRCIVKDMVGNGAISYMTQDEYNKNLEAGHNDKEISDWFLDLTLDKAVKGGINGPKRNI